jgi:hypothetical protein
MNTQCTQSPRSANHVVGGGARDGAADDVIG